ncbi:MAG TPA: energy-coupling factor transporter ATPase [Acholeplasmataceae bacterium]|nr:energy-coupling factor transporter ATPase [Acholeplasmataceae bacterium]
MGIKLHEVSFAYYVPKSKKKPIHFTLKDINIDINSRDEFIGLVGHTGSGKSTLVQLLNALYLPTKGEIDIFGNVITYKSKIKLKPIRKTVGLVFQFPEYQIFEDTVLKDIMFGPKNFGIENPEQVAREVAEILGISDLLDRSPFNLSGGQMRKVAIAGILASKPEILILDEPTAGLDPLTKIEFLEFLKELNEKHHKSIIIITHDMDIVSKYLKRVLVLKQGNLMFDGPKNKLFENEKLLQTCHLDYPKMIRIMKALKEKLNLDINIYKYTPEEAFAEIKRVVGENNE